MYMHTYLFMSNDGAQEGSWGGSPATVLISFN